MNIELILPSRIFFRSGSAKNIRTEVARLGGKGIVIITSPGMPRRTSLTRITDELEKDSADLNIYSQINPEPSIEDAHKCLHYAKDGGCDLIIGLGGGSALDVAKKVATDLSIPKIMIPTTAGSGSEVSHEVVFKIEGKKKALVDSQLVPDVAIVDPDLSKTMPPWLAASSAADALAHAVECSESRGGNPLTNMLALRSFALLKGNIKRALQGSGDARNCVSLGSLLAGMAFANATTTLAHALSYPLSNRGLPHGEAIAMTLGYAVEFNGSDFNIVEELGEIRKFTKSRWDANWVIEDMAREVLADKRHLANNPVKVMPRDIISMFKRMKDEYSTR